MDHRKLRRRLRVLAKKAHEGFPNLNFGGCCVFAAAVATELERHGVKYEVISAGPDFLDLNEVRPPINTVRAWNDVGVGFGHVGVRLKLKGKWYTYDSEAALMPGKKEFGVRWYGQAWNAAKGGISAAEATELADEPEGWNSAFHRGNVPLVRSLVKEMLT